MTNQDNGKIKTHHNLWRVLVVTTNKGILFQGCQLVAAYLKPSSMVYKIPCSVCPMVYIGQTGCRFNQRLCEHKRAVKTADFNSSALAEHAWSVGHAVDWENVSIVNRCFDYHSRIVSEAIVLFV